MAKKAKKENLEGNLKERFTRWDYLYKYGGYDPFWSDGTNLNLVRNQIIYTKRQIEQAYQSECYPEIYYRETPPEVDLHYMARPDEIRTNAKKSLMLYKSDKNYLYLKENAEFLTEKEKKELCINNVLNYKKTLQEAIVNDDLIVMRIHKNPKSYLDSFLECSIKMKKILTFDESRSTSLANQPRVSQMSFL